MSKRVTSLEARLGVRLLHRSTRRVTLTDEGLRFYEHCAAMLQSARRAEESIADTSRDVTGTVRIDAPVTREGVQSFDAMREAETADYPGDMRAAVVSAIAADREKSQKTCDLLVDRKVLERFVF